MRDLAEGLLGGLIGGVQAGAGSMASIFRDERQNQMRIDTDTQLAQAQADIQAEKQKAIEEWRLKKEDERAPEKLRQAAAISKAEAQARVDVEKAALNDPEYIKGLKNKDEATSKSSGLIAEQTKALKLSNQQAQELADKRAAFVSEKDPEKKRQLQEEYQALTGKDPDKSIPVMGKDEMGNPVFLGMADTKNQTFTPAADLPSGRPKQKKGGRGLDEIFGNTPETNKETPSVTAASVKPARSIEEVDAEIKKVEPLTKRFDGNTEKNKARLDELYKERTALLGRK